jgi:hypothetical protein
MTLIVGVLTAKIDVVDNLKSGEKKSWLRESFE